MALKDLKSIHDLVQGDGPVGEMANQTGPNFPITGPKTERGAYPFSVPNNSNLHAGPLEDQAGKSLVGSAYQYAYGGAAASVNPSTLDLNGIAPDSYPINNETKSPLLAIKSIHDLVPGNTNPIGTFAGVTPSSYNDNLPD